MKIAGFVVLAALSGWLVRGVRFDSEPAPAPVAAAPIIQSEPLPDAPAILQRVPSDGSLGHRNLFAYRVKERPAVIAAPAVYVPPVIVETPPVAIVETPAAPAPVPFPWRYIGTFGPAHNRVAAFKRDGDIITARAGDRIGGFVLRSIGIESVVVEGADGSRRIPLSSDV